MITEQQMKTLFVQANPIPDTDLVDLLEMDGTAYLATLEQRSSEVTQLDTRPTETSNPRRGRLLLVWGATAAAVLIGAVVILNQPEEVSPPATQPTSITQPNSITELTPTTVASVADPLDPIAEEGLSVAVGFVEALLAGDLSTAQNLALESVPLFLVDGGGSPGAGPEGELPWKNALGWEATLDECMVTTANSDSARITCSVTNSTDISRAIGADPYTSLHHYTVMYEGGTYFGQTIDDTRIVSSGGDADTWEKIGYEEFKARVFDPFMAWLEANHRDDLEQVMWHAFDAGVFSPDRWLTGDFGPSHTVESVELWRQYSEEFIATQIG